MAKPKRELIIKRFADEEGLHIYTLNVEDGKLIADIEGVSNVMYYKSSELFSVWINPLYDIADVEKEIRDLLTAQIPSVFIDQA